MLKEEIDKSPTARQDRMHTNCPRRSSSTCTKNKEFIINPDFQRCSDGRSGKNQKLVESFCWAYRCHPSSCSKEMTRLGTHRRFAENLDAVWNSWVS